MNPVIYVLTRVCACTRDGRAWHHSSGTIEVVLWVVPCATNDEMLLRGNSQPSPHPHGPHSLLMCPRTGCTQRA